MFIFILQFFPTPITAHVIRDIQTMELDITPELQDATWSSIPVTIENDQTIVNLPVMERLTTQHLFYGNFNFTDVYLDYNGIEAYFVYLHQTIYIQDKLGEGPTFDIKLGSRTQKLSNSALRDAKLSFIYTLANLNDLNFVTEEILTGFSNIDKFLFKISTSLEFIRGTKQNASFRINYGLESYRPPDLPTDIFHNKLLMNTTAIPNKIEIDDTSIIATKHPFNIFLPDEMIPKYFEPKEDHSLNLTEIPLTIWITLRYSNSANEYLRETSIKSNNYLASLKESSGREEFYKLKIKLKYNPLIPLILEIKGFEGQISVKIELEMTSLFADTRLYAKNEYYFSPNQYIMMIVIFSTVFLYKIVDYMDYRKFQNELSYKNPGLVEEEFMG
jgi:hypothetical protein